MAKRYAVLLRAAEPRASVPPEDWDLRREGFAWLALAFPGLWLLFNGAWKLALAVILLPLPLLWFLPWAAPVLSVALGLIVAFEGRDWLIGRAERRGWRRVGTLLAGGRREAEDKLAVLATRGGVGLRAARAVRVPDEPSPPSRRSTFGRGDAAGAGTA